MGNPVSPGMRFQKALKAEKPLQIVGVPNAYAAILAEKTGFKALYLSGGGVSAGALGLPDLGYLTLGDVALELERLTRAVSLPVLVDVDTGFGGPGKALRELERRGAAALHMEDQVDLKRCGHRPGKRLVTAGQMADRIKAAVDARRDRRFAVMARSDALAVEGKQALLDRLGAYVRAGADMVFPEAVGSLPLYREIVKALPVPVLANLTEFGLTPLFTLAELQKTGVSMALYPLSAFRASSRADLRVYQALRKQGTQKRLLKSMQTREELYRFLGYDEMERRADRALNRTGGKTSGRGRP